VTFLTEYNVTISYDVFVSVLLVEQEIAFIHDAVFFLLHVCLCALRKYWSLLWVTWRTFYIETRPQIIQSFWSHTKKTFLVSPLVIPGNAGYPN
jgi:hypothetical protein